MVDAPEKIWAWPFGNYYTAGQWSIGSPPHSTTEYTRSDLVAELATENERLRKALEFYADEDRWHDFKSDQMSAAFDRNFGTEFSADMGALARRALEGGENG